MKRILSFILIFVLLLPMCIFTGLAADEEPSFYYELSIDGKDVVEVRKGDKITVSLYLQRTDSDEAYTMYAMQDEIRYDSSFFKLVKDSAVLNSGITSTDISVQGGMREFYMNYVSMTGGREWGVRTFVGSFQLEVIAESGVSTITNEDYLVSYKDGRGSYPCEANELTVIVTTDCTVQFETNGGSKIEPVSVIYGETLSRPADPVREGKQFVGWYTDIHLTKAWDFENNTVKGNMTLYAKWENAVVPPAEEYSLTLDANGGQLAQNPSGKYTAGTSIALPVPTRTAYRFDGWYDGDVRVPNGNYVLSKDTALQAKWSAAEYTITFDTAGGQTLEPVKYTVEGQYTLPTPVREGYGFIGWELVNPTEGWQADIYAAGTSVNGKYGDIKFIARWSYGFFYEVEDYRYAPKDYVLLRIAAEDNTDAYSIDGAPMYYTDDANYHVEGRGVFYTLIPAKYIAAGSSSLTPEAIEKLSRTGLPAEVIVRDGDINGDGKTTLEDAELVYSMVEHSGNSYTLDELSIAQRLAADVNTARNPGDNLYRGSLADVNAIVNMVNGAK